jgi:hypothetical protein
MRTPLGWMTILGVAFLAASGAVAGQDQAAAGTASGTMMANGKTVTLKFAQAKKDGDDWIVLLSDVPTSFAESGWPSLVESGKLHRLELTFAANGEVKWWQMAHNSLAGGAFATSRVSASKATKMGPAVVEGMAQRAKDEMGGETTEFDVKFKAPVTGK